MSLVPLVMPTLGVRLLLASGVFHGFCAGLGVILTKSARSNAGPGVVGKRPLGVIMLLGSAGVFSASVLLRITLLGGVDGGSIKVVVPLFPNLSPLVFLCRFGAGLGLAAR